MEFLLISGQQNTGKSETIARIFMLLSPKYPSITNVHPHTSLPPTNPFKDFSAILEGLDTNGKQVKVLIHSPTDDTPNITLLQKNIITHSPDVVISSIRDIHCQRQNVLNIISQNLSSEIPLARITRRGANPKNPSSNFSQALNWYRNSVDSVIYNTLSQSPFNII